MRSLNERTARGWTHLAIAVIVLGSALFFVSCYPGDELTVSDLDVVATFFNESANFAMPSFVFDLNDSSMEAAPDVIAEIKEHMEEYGYTEADSDSADVRLVSFKTQTTWVGGSCYPSYYPYYYGWCYPVAYSYQTGTFLMVMLDNSDTTTTATALWVAGLNGVLEGSTQATLTTRLHNGIHQAFEQSPYLADGK
jgi:hypothetical protein